MGQLRADDRGATGAGLGLHVRESQESNNEALVVIQQPCCPTMSEGRFERA